MRTNISDETFVAMNSVAGRERIADEAGEFVGIANPHEPLSVQARPSEYNKAPTHVAIHALAVCQSFMLVNDLPLPVTRFCPLNAGRGEARFGKPTMVLLDIERLSYAGQGYSFPGWRADCTIHGVLAHEFGHAVHFARMGEREQSRVRWEREWRAAKLERVTRYCGANSWEHVAETLRVFILNPALLRSVAPRAFEYMSTQFFGGLRPLHDVPAGEVLRYSNKL